MGSILKIRNLNYNNFKNIDLDIEKGCFYTIVGGNGSGKTTLLNILCGIIPTTNIVTCNKIVLSKENVNSYIKNIGVCSKLNKNSFLFDTVKEELIYPLHNLGYSKIFINKKIKKILKDFNCMNIYDKNINDLSDSLKQKLLLIISIIHKPKVLLLDEVFSNLDNKQKTITYLKQLIKEKKLTVINFTINLEEALEGDNLLLLSSYNINILGNPKKALLDDQKFIDNGLELPFMYDLSLKLKTYGLVNEIYFNMEELVNHLWK